MLYMPLLTLFFVCVSVSLMYMLNSLSLQYRECLACHCSLMPFSVLFTNEEQHFWLFLMFYPIASSQSGVLSCFTTIGDITGYVYKLTLFFARWAGLGRPVGREGIPTFLTFPFSHAFLQSPKVSFPMHRQGGYRFFGPIRGLA